MIIERLNNAGNWEDMTCDECGNNEWDIEEEYKNSTAFVCVNCNEPGPIVENGGWNSRGQILRTYDELEECVQENACTGFKTVPEFSGLVNDVEGRIDSLKDWFLYSDNYAIANFEGPTLSISFWESNCEICKIPV